MTKKFEFKKLSNDKYAFVMNSEDIERTEVVSKEFAKKHHAELIEQRQQLLMNASQLRKVLLDNPIESDPELEHFIELANKAGAYKKNMDTKMNLTAAEDMLKSVDESIESIEHTIPELMRNKK